ncbi:MAG: hypothetical protein MI725_03725, partial [Pirellulales bacterium]|nr:hypothetical protein [Pirellulales bacterium]
EAAQAGGHQLVWCGDIGEVAADWFSELSLEDQGDDWQALFEPTVCDAVLVGQGCCPQELRADQLNQLVRGGVALLTTFPLVDSVLTFYEIDMARCESGAVLHHFNPLREQSPIIDECAGWVRTRHPQLGAVEQVVWERPLAERTRQRVLWHFARDVELLSHVAGRLDRLAALGSPNEQATYAGLSVQLLGVHQVPVRWSVSPIEQSDHSRLILIAEQGRAVVEFNADGLATELKTLQEGSTTTKPLEMPDASTALQRFVTAVETEDSESSTWPAALRSMELTDTIEISLRRGRMIDVHPQQLTEQLAFKGTMSALGCGVLIVLVPLLLALGWLAEQVGIPVAGYWPHVLLALLALFLILQLVPKFLLDGVKNDSTELNPHAEE